MTNIRFVRRFRFRPTILTKCQTLIKCQILKNGFMTLFRPPKATPKSRQIVTSWCPTERPVNLETKSKMDIRPFLRATQKSNYFATNFKIFSKVSKTSIFRDFRFQTFFAHFVCELLLISTFLYDFVHAIYVYMLREQKITQSIFQQARVSQQSNPVVVNKVFLWNASFNHQKKPKSTCW